MAQTRMITGRIVNSENQQPVYNAAVNILGSKSVTFTNILGYFQLELAKGSTELMINHVGYHTGLVKIPKVDNFSINLNPAKQVKSIDLNNYAQQNEINKDQLNNQDSDNLSIVERHAEYHEGWNRFYTEFGNQIVKDSGFVNSSFEAYLEFIITAKGDIEGLKLNPDSIANKEIIIKAISKLGGWKPAFQINEAVNQAFLLKIHFDNTSEVFQPVEVTASPQEGIREFYKFVAEKIKYPRKARNLGIEGKVYVQFVVQKDGSLSDIQIVKGIGGDCDKEVLRVIKTSPKWRPALSKNLPVRQVIVLPITFSLGEPKKFKDSFVTSSRILTGIFVTAINIEREKKEFDIELEKKLEETAPEFPGGHKKMVKFIEKNRKEISEKLPPNKSEDKVQVGFTVDKYGKIGPIKVENSLGRSFDNEAIRLYSIMPPWIPAESNGEAIEKTISATVYFGVVSKNKIESANTSFNRGIGLIERGKFEKSLRHFSKAIEDHPSNLDYYFNRSAVNLELGNIDKACADLEFIKSFDQEALDAYNEYCNKN